MSRDELIARVSGRRLSDDLWRLVGVPSPTGHEREAALLYAGMLEEAGAAVVVDDALPESPNVIGRLRGSSPGPTLQIAGHLDHIDVPHPPPERTARTVSGRGAADMKNGLAAALELVRVLASSGRPFPGQILLTAYGLHEAPVGHAEGLLAMLDAGIKGDAALVLEGPPDRAVVCGKGQSIWNLVIRRDGQTCHELGRPPDSDALLETALELAREIRREDGRLAAAPHEFPLLGAESVFLGQLHYGDFYNRAPAACALQGTRRWHPDKTFDLVQAELHDLVSRIGAPPEISVEESWTFVGESFSVDPEEPVVRALRAAYECLQGKPLELAGCSSVLDTNRLVPCGLVPAVPIDCHGVTGHADREEVRIDLLEAGCRLALLTALEYLEGARETT